MGGKNSKEVPLTKSETKYLADPPQANFEGQKVPSDTAAAAPLTPFLKYKKFRDELMSFSLGESAYDYAERLYKEEPNSPEVMALLAETTTLYDLTKNKHQRDHWIDRLDLLQRGIDVSRKCFKENPEYGPCYRAYVMCAVRASESLYFYRWMRAVGLLENYNAIIKRGEVGLKYCPEDPDLPAALGALSCRCAYNWYNPYRVLARIYNVPAKKQLYAEGIRYLSIAAERDPESLEIACRLGMAYFYAGDFANARRWYCKVRDEMPPRDLKDEKWQSVAHTQLSTQFQKTRWNVPFA